MNKAGISVHQITSDTFRGTAKPELLKNGLIRLASKAKAGKVTQAVIDKIFMDERLQEELGVGDEKFNSDAHLQDLALRFIVLKGVVDGTDAVLDLAPKGETDWKSLILDAGERVRGKYKIDLQIFRNALTARGLNPDSADEFLQAYEGHRQLTQNIDSLRGQQKIKFKGKPSEEEIKSARQRGIEIKSKITEAEQTLNQLSFRLAKLALSFPNLQDASVPVGPDASSNQVVRVWGQPANFPFTAKDHATLGEELGILDFARGTKLAQSRFVAHRGIGAKLERALISFMLDLHTREHGYTEWWLPELVNSTTMFGTGQFPGFVEQMFSCNLDDLHLIPTAEVPLTNLHRQEILKAADLPLRYTAYTSCFRREAGSAGRDVRGMIRVHQFDKVELVILTRPEDSFQELETMVGRAEEVLKRLGLPHRTVLLSSGDMGSASAKTYDLEAWLPSQNRWMEISSCSNCTDWQGRRLATRVRKEDGSLQYVHTLNGSGVAVGRTLVALLENYQQPDGTVLIPDTLKPYMNGLEKISK